MQLYLALAIPLLLATAWLYTAQMTRRTLPQLRNKRICLLIAHPDDEAMFFAPTLTAITAPEFGNHVKILCLSSGNADGLGELRKKELGTSAVMLGLRNANDVLVIEDEAFPDSMTVSWPTEKIAQVLRSAFASTAREGGKKPKPPTTTLDVLITFDGQGVSSHPNHISLYHGAKVWLASLMHGKAGWQCPVDLYTLTSTNVVRKYMTVLDGPLTLFLSSLRGMGQKGKQKREHPPGLAYISNYNEYRQGQKAMTRCHKSQMHWFRWGWIGVSRYMMVNDLKQERIVLPQR